jgi:hypothetical protein
MNLRRALAAALVAAAALAGAAPASAACCYFSALNSDIAQPAQKVFITWDPEKKQETFTVQPKFEGNALDFGMVIPTPTQPKLHEMPRAFFKHLAVFTVLKKAPGGFGGKGGGGKGAKGGGGDDTEVPSIKILETGVVGSLEYKIIEAGRADDLFQWLKDNKYNYAGDEATLNHYIKQKWIFTVMKIDTMQMKKNKEGTYDGEVTPTRFTFSSEKLVYPLKITQISVKDKTEALFYVQAPFKTDLKGDFSYQHTWVPMLLATAKKGSKMPNYNLPGKAGQWLQDIETLIPGLLDKNRELGWEFKPRTRPGPNAQGRIPTTMEWAKKLTEKDIAVLKGDAPYSEPRAKRVAPEEEVKALMHLLGHLQEGTFITKFRKTFTRGEMGDDLEIVAARLGEHEDSSEYEQILPSSPP